MTLRDRIYAYFLKQPMVWIPSAQIEKIVSQNTKYIASNASRQCRQLAQDGLLEREERPYQSKNIAWYRYNPKAHAPTLLRLGVEWFNALP